MSIECLDTLRVVGTTTKTTTIGCANHQRAGPISARAIANFRRFSQNMIGGSVNEVGALDLANWSQPFHRETDGHTSNGAVGHRCGYDTPWANALQPTLGRTGE